MILGFSNILRNSTPFYYVDLPSFQRDFAALKTLDHGTGPNITFTRASDATYFDANGVLQTASNDAPRFDHDPATGASRGLLIEEARTNLLERSEDFTTTWTVDNSGAANPIVTSNYGVAPDGNSTADRVQLDKTGGTFSRLQQSMSSLTSAVYTFSVWMKTTSGGTANVGIRVNADGINCAVTADWKRFSVTLAAAGTNGTSQVLLLDSIASNDETADILVWGAQLEAGAFPTSYIPTTTAAVTRSADSAVVTPISSFYNQAEGTLFAEWNTPVGNVGIVAISDNSSLNRFAILNTTSTLVPNGNVRVDNVAQCSITVGAAATASDILKFVLAAKVDDFQAARGGVLGTADTSGTLPTLTHLRLGAAGSSSNLINGHIRKIAYWPKRLSNTLLQQLTT